MNKDNEIRHLNSRYKRCQEKKKKNQQQQQQLLVELVVIQLQSRDNLEARQDSAKSLGEPKRKFHGTVFFREIRSEIVDFCRWERNYKMLKQATGTMILLVYVGSIVI